MDATLRNIFDCRSSIANFGLRRPRRRYGSPSAIQGSWVSGLSKAASRYACRRTPNRQSAMTWCMRMDSNHRRTLTFRLIYSQMQLPLCHSCKRKTWWPHQELNPDDPLIRRTCCFTSYGHETWSFPRDLNSANRFTKPTHRHLCLESKLEQVERIELPSTSFADSRLSTWRHPRFLALPQRIEL